MVVGLGAFAGPARASMIRLSKILRRAALACACVVLSVMAPPASAVVGGTPASQGEFPWMAAVYRSSTTRRGVSLLIEGQFCGGSLIAPTVVLTGKHCVTELLDVDNLLGLTPEAITRAKLGVMVNETKLSQTGERRLVKRVSVIGDPDSDAAILLLAAPSTVTPARFARAGDEALFADRTLATVLGWGNTAEGAGFPDDLQKAEVPVNTDDYCGDAYPGEAIADATVCAGFPEGGVDTCQGDSGGPIAVRDNAQWVVFATTWFGDGCARPNKPGVYSETIFAQSFIEAQIATQ